jgi:hypothetical protein
MSFGAWKALLKAILNEVDHEDLKTILVDPENTSSRSPNSRHIEFVGYKNIELEGVATSRERDSLLEHRAKGYRS